MGRYEAVSQSVGCYGGFTWVTLRYKNAVYWTALLALSLIHIFLNKMYSIEGQNAHSPAAAEAALGAEAVSYTHLKADGELNAKYPGGAEAQRARLEAEGHTVIRRGRTNIRYYVQDYEDALFELE